MSNRGGARPGAGRPRKNPGAQIIPIDIAARKAAARKGSPLAYILEVMNDPTADPARRDKMALAALPHYYRQSGSGPPVGKKVKAQQEAAAAGAGTDWGSDLGGD